MGKLTDIQIRNWIKAGERFEQRSDGDGLYLRFRAADKLPGWQFRYRFAGKQRVMLIGGYGALSLSDARKESKRLAAQVALGIDVAGDKQTRKAEAAGKMHVFGGAPGTGKTTIAMGLATTVAVGGCWPDGTRSIAGNVVIWSGEDDPADTLIPRLVLSGADLSRVYFIADIGGRDRGRRRGWHPGGRQTIPGRPADEWADAD